MLFRTYSKPVPTKIKLDDIAKEDVMAVYAAIRDAGNAVRAWSEKKADGTVEKKTAAVDYKLSVYREIEEIVKEIIAETERQMQSENKPTTKSELNQAIKDAGLKVSGLNISEVLNDIIAHSDGNPAQNKTFKQFSDMFVNPSV